MKDDVVIKAEHVSKKFCKSLKRSMLYGMNDIGRNLFRLSSRPENLRESEFWAVDDVSFELKKGEMLGLIGANGSGKSTLLKMLNGIFWPDKGKITMKGRVGALIELGVGFHPLLTGRENVYINGAILGMTKEEVDAKFDDITEFAGIGDFIDAPVKTYSSGMFIRLGFSVAAHSNPDVLLVDEVLAVGDVNFYHQCLRYFAELKKRCAIILVSHNLDVVRFMCQKALFLCNGKAQFLGPSSEGVDEYINYMMRRRLPENNITINRSRYDSKVEIQSVSLLDKNYNEIAEINVGEPLIIECAFTVGKRIRQGIINFGLNQDSVETSDFQSYSTQVNEGQYYDLSEGEHRFRVIIPELNLKKGLYNVGVSVCEKTELAYHATNNDKNILVKTPHPEFGLYNMKFHFEMDEERKSLGMCEDKKS
jgi:lipopolysaccharide transport system ATP-binding protein